VPHPLLQGSNVDTVLEVPRGIRVAEFVQKPAAEGMGEPLPLKELLKTMRERAARFNVEKIKPQDLAGTAGPPSRRSNDSNTDR